MNPDDFKEECPYCQKGKMIELSSYIVLGHLITKYSCTDCVREYKDIKSIVK